MNRKWQVGVATALLVGWMAAAPAQAQFTSPFELSSLDGSNGFVINGIDADDQSGRSVSFAGDINGDGIDDLVIGARYADPNGSASGESYIVFGTSSGFSASLELSALNGSNGFVLNGIDATDLSGFSVSAAGDINGDGAWRDSHKPPGHSVHP